MSKTGSFPPPTKSGSVFEYVYNAVKYTANKTVYFWLKMLFLFCGYIYNNNKNNYINGKN